MVVSAAIMVGATNGYASGVFAVAVVVALIVMYDATGVRRETGRQATVINQILQDVLINGKPISDAELKELVGHKPIEVAGGALVGATCSACCSRPSAWPSTSPCSTSGCPAPESKAPLRQDRRPVLPDFPQPDRLSS